MREDSEPEILRRVVLADPCPAIHATRIAQPAYAGLNSGSPGNAWGKVVHMLATGIAERD